MGIEDRDWYKEFWKKRQKKQFEVDIPEEREELTEEEKRKREEEANQRELEQKEAQKRWLSHDYEDLRAPKQERCRECGVIFPDKHALKQHVLSEHPWTGIQGDSNREKTTGILQKLYRFFFRRV